MWYKCLNPNCGFVFARVGEYDRCPDCGKQHLREATNEEIESVTKNGEECKPPLDDVIAIAKSRVQPPTEQKKYKPNPREIGGREH